MFTILRLHPALESNAPLSCAQSKQSLLSPKDSAHSNVNIASAHFMYGGCSGFGS